MVRYTVIMFIALAGIALPGQDTDKARDVGAKAIQAHGGEKNLKKNVAGQVTVKGTVKDANAGDIDFTQSTTYMLPDKLKESAEYLCKGVKYATQILVNGKAISTTVAG